MAKRSTVVLEDVQLIFRNFSGSPTPYAKKGGDRTFAVLLDDDVAEAMVNDGWNVKRLRPRDEGDIGQAYINVSVRYGVRNPRVVMLTDWGQTELVEDTIDTLDWADILSADLVIRPYEWEVDGRNGVKAYLQSLFVRIDEDPLARKYAGQ